MVELVFLGNRTCFNSGGDGFLDDVGVYNLAGWSLKNYMFSCSVPNFLKHKMYDLMADCFLWLCYVMSNFGILSLLRY